MGYILRLVCSEGNVSKRKHSYITARKIWCKCWTLSVIKSREFSASVGKTTTLSLQILSSYIIIDCQEFISRYRIGYYIAIQKLICVLETFTYVDILLTFWKAYFVMPMCFQISASVVTALSRRLNGLILLILLHPSHIMSWFYFVWKRCILFSYININFFIKKIKENLLQMENRKNQYPVKIRWFLGVLPFKRIRYSIQKVRKEDPHQYGKEQ